MKRCFVQCAVLHQGNRNSHLFPLRCVWGVQDPSFLQKHHFADCGLRNSEEGTPSSANRHVALKINRNAADHAGENFPLSRARFCEMADEHGVGILDGGGFRDGWYTVSCPHVHGVPALTRRMSADRGPAFQLQVVCVTAPP